MNDYKLDSFQFYGLGQDSIFNYATSYLSTSVTSIYNKTAKLAKNLFLQIRYQIHGEKEILFHELKKHQKMYQNVLNCSLSQPDGSLESNLKLAHELLEYTKNSVPFSSNNMDRGRSKIVKTAQKIGVTLDSFSEISDEAHKHLKGIREKVHLENTNKSDFAYRRIQAKTAVKNCIGNCGELALVSIFRGAKEGIWNTLLERASIVNGDHVILLIGRDKQSKRNDYKTWGKKAVVMDPWTNKVYEASKIEQELQNYINVCEHTGSPFLEPFNTKKHSLEIEFGNISTVQDLVDLKDAAISESDVNDLKDADKKIIQEALEKLDEAIFLLDRFHNNESIVMQLSIAHSLIKICSDPIFVEGGPIELLKDQLEYFIEMNL